MPRVSKKAKLKRSGYDDGHILHLREGVYLCIGHGFCVGPRVTDYKAMEEAWNILREQILAEWIAERPGTRPYAWWRFDAPERRRRVDGKPHPFDCPKRQAEVERRVREFGNDAEYLCGLYYGRPRCSFMPDDFDAEYEQEWEYLQRLGLLLPGESKDCGNGR